MAFLWASVLGFLMVLMLDIAALAGYRNLKPLIGGSGAVLLLYAIAGTALSSPKYPRAPWLVAAGIVVAGAGAALLFYSLFVDIPPLRTYAASGPGSELVTTGTYALCRHPGILWLALMLLGLLVASGSYRMLWMTPIWIGLDIGCIWIQDRYIFPRQFPGYQQYQRMTPMLLPTQSSLRRCLRTLRARAS